MSRLANSRLSLPTPFSSHTNTPYYSFTRTPHIITRHTYTHNVARKSSYNRPRTSATLLRVAQSGPISAGIQVASFLRGRRRRRGHKFVGSPVGVGACQPGYKTEISSEIIARASSPLTCARKKTDHYFDIARKSASVKRGTDATRTMAAPGNPIMGVCVFIWGLAFKLQQMRAAALRGDRLRCMRMV